jgi:hypothetical protein
MEEYITNGLVTEQKLEIDNEGIYKVNKFLYFRSVLESDGKIYSEIEKKS